MSKPKQPNGDEATAKAKAICFYLPQFHQVPENDEWWGEGFTEWTLLNKAKPQFSGHQQPIEPATEVGQYNLLQKSVRKRHAHMAREYGIHGFCYYHYWFNGKQLLEKPLQAMLDDGEPNLPFCLCWANEPWTRTWQGQGDSVLQAQEYGDRQDWVNHFEALLPFLRHENAITVDGRPLLLIYRSGQISELAEMVACWRELGIKAGIGELMLLAAIGNFADN
ncbi:MAG: lipopolysaccharide biosynthesis protein, partial [Polaribacter sp.]